MAADALQCLDCRMVFTSQDLLRKHRLKFCVGGSLGDPQQLLLNGNSAALRSTYAEREAWAKNQRNIAASKVAELQQLKQQKAASRQQRDAEERHMLEQMSSQTPEVDRLSVEHDIDDYVTKAEETPRRSMEREWEKHRWQLQAASHSKNLYDFQSHGRDLERKRADISRRIDELSSQPSATQQMLQRLEEQEARNQEMLNQLQQQVADMQLGRQKEKDSTGKEENREISHCKYCQKMQEGVKMPDIHAATLQYKWVNDKENDEAYRKCLQAVDRKIKIFEEQLSMEEFGSTGGQDSLVSEIRAMRQSYLKRGGSNPSILAQIADMEADALSLETRNTKLAAKKQHTDSKTVSKLQEQVMSFELENERLQQQLRQMQNTGQDTDRSVRSSYGGSIYTEQKQQEHLRKLQELEQEMELVKQQAKLERLKNEIPAEIPKQAPPVNHAMPPQPVPVQQDAEMPTLLANRYAAPPMVLHEPLGPAPYDPQAGFVVFYDFVLELEPSLQSCRLVAGLYNKAGGMGQPTILPTVYCEPGIVGTHQQGTSMVYIKARQPVPRCPPATDLAVVVEFQASSVVSPRLTTRGWCKFDLFDRQLRIISGRWRIPLRVAPVQPGMACVDLNTVPQYGLSELYYRVVNFRDVDNQSMKIPSIQEASQYMHPPQIAPPVPEPVEREPSPSIASTYNSPHASSAHFPLPYNPPPSLPPTPRAQNGPSPRRRHPEDPDFSTIGFQVDRVKHGEDGEGKVRITAYHKKTGKIVQSSSSPVTCSTAAVKSNYKHSYHIFGQQEATFVGVDLTPDVVVVLKFYLRHRVDRQGPEAEGQPYDDESFVAWTYLPLLLPAARGKTPTGKLMRRGDDISGMVVNTGTHVLQLLQPPIPALDRIPIEDGYHPDRFDKYCRATVRIHLFQGAPRPGSITPSEDSEEEEEDVLPRSAWLENERLSPPSEPFTATDAFDLYVDACRCLPDSVTITRVAGRLLDRKYEKVGKDISALPKLDSDVYNPVYNTRIEFREPNLPPSATLLLKVYTIDKFRATLMVVGYATLNVFVESGTDKQPLTDQGGIQISLNEEGHQLRLYQTGPDPAEPLTESCLRDRNSRRVPCASLLVRIYKATVGPQGKPLEAEKIPQTDWARMGLWKPRPYYTDKGYFTTACKPTTGECRLYRTMVRRQASITRDNVHLLADSREARLLQGDKSIETFIRDKLTKLMDAEPADIDLNYIAKYNPKWGIKVAIDSASQLPWAGFTYAHFCLNPPAAFYMGQPNAAYDKPVFLRDPDITSLNRSPRWMDGFKHFPNRSHHHYLTVIIHLQEIAVTVGEESYKYSLLDQAWTAVQAFSEGYVLTQPFQLPLLQGGPTQQMLKQLTREPCKEWMLKNIRAGNLRLAEPGSITVRLCDARRDEEVPPPVEGEYSVPVNTDYMPWEGDLTYTFAIEPRELQTMVPPGKVTEEFFSNLAVKYRSLVYKLYDEGKMGK